MAQKRVRSSRFPGVYWRETTDPKRRYNGRPDRCYDYCLRENGKLRWVNVGWLSEGFSEQKAANMRREAQERLARGGKSSPRQQEELTLDAAAQAYFAWMEGEGKHAKQERNRYGLHVCDALGHLPVSTVSTGHVDTLKKGLLQTMAPSSALKVLATCRAIVNHAIRDGRWAGLNPFGSERLKMPRPQNRGERFLSPDEARRLLEELERRSPQLRDMAWLSLKTGLRSTEIFRLTGADIDREGKVLWITEKGGRRAAIRVAQDVLDTLAAYGRAPEEYVFQERGGGKLKQISTSFGRACVAAGLESPEEEGRKRDPRKKMWFHVLRHTFASWLAQSGTVTLQELRDLMRHGSITMTERYAHLIPGQAQKKTAIIDALLKG